MSREVEENVRSRAGNRCEYCLFPQTASKLKFHIEHIIARKHGGPTESGNLALACGRCNYSKGSNLSGIDKHTKNICRLFNPRSDQWRSHFRYDGPVLVGLTAIGQVTVEVLNINNPMQMAARQALIDEDVFVNL